MRFDELPPESPAARPETETATGAAEPSSSDAPPAKPARRRRAAGTDAASASQTPDSQSQSSPPSSRRRAPRAVSVEATTEPTLETSQPTEAAPDTSTEARPRRRRGPARQSNAEPVTDSAEPASASVPPLEATPDATPAKKPSRRKKATVAEESAAQDAKPDSAEAAGQSSAEAAVAESPTPSRRRGGNRRAKAVAIAEPEAAAVAPPSEVVAHEEIAAPAPAEMEMPPAEDKPARRRGGRGRKRTDAPISTEPPAETDSGAVSQDSVVESETPVVEAEKATAPASRRRRGGRARRSETRAASADHETPLAGDETAAAPRQEPEPKIDRTVGAHLVMRHGCPEIRINGVAYPPVLFFGNLAEEKSRTAVTSEVRRAARAGVHLHSTLVELPCPLTENSAALDEIDNRLRAILDADPEGYVMPRIIFVPARGWRREYPTEIATYADGTTGDPSITSNRFWEEAERSLTALIAHLRDYEWGKRVFGYHLEHGEWFQSAANGHDRSLANRDAFRDWLREKYEHNLTSLRAAWYDGDVQFHTAEIPPQLTKPNPQRAFFETRRERRYIDFYEFTSESTAQRILTLARAVKKATNHQALVSVCYGYTFEFGHPGSGHLALNQLLSAQTIDLICGPPSYRDRKPGGAASIPAPVDSLPLHGKLWLSEDDTKSYLAPAQQDPEDFNPRLGDRFATEQAQARAMGRALAHTTAIGWMDLWGEGWLDDEGIWERLGAFTERYRAFLRQRDRPRTPDVVALIDEKSLLHIQRGEAFFRKLTNGLRDVLQRAGVSYGTYLQSDLTARDFPTDAKLYLFLTPYRLNAEQSAAIKEKLQRGGKTLVWLYAPGSCEERPSVGGMMEETSTGTIGLSLRQQAWNSEIGSRILDPNHIITQRLPSREIGTRERLNPSFYVDDAEAVVLAEYQGTGLPSLAVKDCGAWKSVFLGEPTLPLELLRGLCRYAGVPIWTPQGEDIVTVGNGWVTVHAPRDGQRALHLPEPTGLYDATENRLIADEIQEHRYFLRAGMTRLFCVGPTEHLHRLGLPNLTLPGSGRERIVLLPRPDLDALPPPLRADLETLEAVLTVDLSALEELEVDSLNPLAETDYTTAAAIEPLTGEVVTGGRRRRRGGRGRGRRRLGSLEERRDATAGAEPLTSPLEDEGFE